ncbi:unnamed protein product [Urochloa decumbens]|uniref:Uncharacterized protein n=1 Tax=Urochloa decumbens TaxID=240449 RepID=A0ABC9FYW4_9POAL
MKSKPIILINREEYIARRQKWCSEDCWAALATEWSSPEFKEKSVRNRGNRRSHNFKPHKGGSNSIAVIRQKLSRKYGRDVSDVEAWVHTHRGLNPEDVTSLNTEAATECLETYKAKAIELNGIDFDWLHSPVDVRALYQCNCGRQHGKWATFNGTIDDTEALPQLNRSRSSVAVRRQHQDVEEQLRKEAHDGRLAKQYAESMLEWGRMVKARDENLQRFMETVAVQIGLPLTTVPYPLPPAPPAPVYAISPSPNPSPDNAATHGSCVREETPKEILSRIAYGGFGACANTNGGDDGATGGANNGQGFGNGTASGGGNYSPPQVDGFPLDAL